LLNEFLLTMLGVAAYQCIGVAVLLPLELALPKAAIPLSRRLDGFIFLLLTVPVTAFVAISVGAVSDALGIQPISLPLGITSPLAAAIILQLWLDLQFYVIHRLQHRYFWRFHAVHHSIRNLSAASSYHHWSEAIMGLTVAIPLMFFDVRTGPTLGLLVVLFRYQQFYIHSSTKAHFGPLRYLLIDNRYHRIHHSLQPEHHDKNFGATSPLWDWVFGTLYMPRSDEWPKVGVVDFEEPRNVREWSTAPWRHYRVSSGGVIQ
jgi:sterol desaturase/sphingolipid hydroxylase (fatty acid hydroxylase superfamily)